MKMSLTWIEITVGECISAHGEQPLLLLHSTCLGVSLRVKPCGFWFIPIAVGIFDRNGSGTIIGSAGSGKDCA